MIGERRVADPVRYELGDAVLIVRRAWCKGCDLCVESCPAGILELDDAGLVRVTDIGRCIFCGICAVRCPDFVFSLERPASNGHVGARQASGVEENVCG